MSLKPNKPSKDKKRGGTLKNWFLPAKQGVRCNEAIIPILGEASA